MVSNYDNKKLILMFFSQYLYSANVKIWCENKNDSEDKLEFTIGLTPDILYYIDKGVYFAMDQEYKIVDSKLLLISNSNVSDTNFNKLGLYEKYETYVHNSQNFYYNYNSGINIYSPPTRYKDYRLYANLNNLYDDYFIDAVKSIGVFIPSLYSEELRKRKVIPYILSNKRNAKFITI